MATRPTGSYPKQENGPNPDARLSRLGAIPDVWYQNGRRSGQSAFLPQAKDCLAPPAVRHQARLVEPRTYDPKGAEAVYVQFLSNVLPYPSGNLHLGFHRARVSARLVPPGRILEATAEPIHGNCLEIR